MTKSAPETRWASRQRKVGESIRRETRRIVLQAATEEFAERGYVAATIRRIAERAQVSVQSVYSACGSKRDLLRAVMDFTLTGDPDRGLTEDVVDQFWEGIAGDASPERVLQYLVHQFCAVSALAHVGWFTYLDAIGTDPDIATDWQELMRIRRDNFGRHISHISDQHLRRGLNRETAVDTAWTLASPQTYDLLVRRAGYRPEHYERWLYDTLCAALLDAPGGAADSGSAPGARGPHGTR